MNKKEFIRWIEEQRAIVPLDGGMGTLLAEKGWTPPMLPEEMNIHNPEIVAGIHAAYGNAGALIIETNTFGGTPIKMAHRGLREKACEINARAARLAKSTVGESALVAGSVGPLGELLAPFGSLTFEEAYDAFRTQMKGLLEGGADFLLIETMIDLREAKAAVLAARDTAPDGAFVVSFTFDQKGRTVTGTPPEVAARWAAFQGAAGVGANCGVGPEAYISTVEVLSEHAGLPVFVYANAGLPGNEEYRSPEVFATWGKRLADAGATVIGGCCGTTPEHIAALVAAVRGVQPKKRIPVRGVPLASRSRLVLAGPEHPFRIIGERINVSRKSPLRDEVERFVWTTLREEARLQTEAGAHVIDVNVGLPTIDQQAGMAAAVSAAGQSTSLPLSIDSDSALVLESGLGTVTGIPLINSFTAREDSLFPGLSLAKRHGAAAVVLPIDENGLPESEEARKRVIRKILENADSLGFPRECLLVDGLTLAVGADHAAPAVTLSALAFLREQGIASILGVSNVSHGMPARSLLNRTFLAMAVAAGLDTAIMNPLDRSMMETLVAAETLAGRDAGGRRFLSAAGAFSMPSDVPRTSTQPASQPTGDETLAVDPRFLPLALSILRGDTQQADVNAKDLLSSGTTPLDVVNKGVIPALEEVGKRYDSGAFFLPQLISSAETAQRVCELAMELVDRAGGISSKGRVLLATVEGDLHDLGKNVVGTVLKSHGFTVVDLGKDVPSARILEEAEKGAFDFVGLSALMTSTMKRMAETTAEIVRRLPGVFVIVGGASVSEDFARTIGAHGYAPDAVSSVRLVESLMASRKTLQKRRHSHAMLIRDLLSRTRPAISFEIFPPKPETPIDTVFKTVSGLKELSPDFISVTYGAGGSSRDRTVEIASAVHNRWGLVSLAHLTCMGSSPVEVEKVMEDLEQEGVCNILAMRGDPRPDGGESYFHHASDLIRHIRRGHFRDFSLGAAAYPEGHPESPSPEEDLFHLKEKVDAGADFLITQLFFDNEIFFRFMEKIRALGITVPVLAGIMPVLNARQIGRIVSLCCASIPPRFARIMSRYEHSPEALSEAGIAYATEQIIDLLSWGADGIHLYTMNRPDVAKRIMESISTVRRTLNESSSGV